MKTASSSPPSREAVEIIRRHNRWRRGDDSIPMASPIVIGEAMDDVCDRVEALEQCAKDLAHLQGAVRNFRAVYGRGYTKTVRDRMFSLLPEGAQISQP